MPSGQKADHGLNLAPKAARRLAATNVLNRARRVAAGPFASNLDRLARVYSNTDKHEDHGYTPLYQRYFEERRRSVRTLIEIGVGGYEHPAAGGGSLRMWRTFFPNARIYGIDINLKIFDDARIELVQGSQSDPEFLRRLIARTGPPDILIDDGSHVMSDILTTFEVLFPLIAPGGFYVIEDLQTAYLADYGGGPPGAPGTAMGLIKDLVDAVNARYVTAGGYPTGGMPPVHAVHAHRNIVFIEKSAAP